MQNSARHLPLMPKSTAVWLIENTALTFYQIAEFCGMHELEVKGIADGDVARGILGIDPVSTGQLTSAEIERCTKDSSAKLTLNYIQADLIADTLNAKRAKKSRYTPIARRKDKYDAIFWLIRNYPDISDAQAAKLIGTTKNTAESIRRRTHWNISELRPRDPVLLGLCMQQEIDSIKVNPKPFDESIENHLKKEVESNHPDED
jgi:hypothetical protein